MECTYVLLSSDYGWIIKKKKKNMQIKCCMVVVWKRNVEILQSIDSVQFVIIYLLFFLEFKSKSVYTYTSALQIFVFEAWIYMRNK